MEMKDYDRLEETLCKELKKIADKGELSAGSLETADKLLHAIKNLYKIEMGYEGGYSQAYSRDGYSQREGGYMMNGGDYSRGNSYANRGQHYVRAHYSRGTEDEMAMNRIRRAMDEQGISGADREAVERVLRSI